MSHAYLRAYLRVTVGHQSGALCTGPAALAWLWRIVKGGATKNIEKPWLVPYLVPGTFSHFVSFSFHNHPEPTVGFLILQMWKVRITEV